MYDIQFFNTQQINKENDVRKIIFILYCLKIYKIAVKRGWGEGV